MESTRDRPSALGHVFVLAGSVVFVASLLGFLDFYLRRSGRTAPDTVTGAAAAAFDVVLFSIFALHHSIFARTGLRNWVQARVSPRYERSIYVWISSLLFIAVYVWWQPVPGVIWAATGPAAVALTAIQVVGILLSVGSARRLDVLDLAGVNQGFDRPTSRPAGLVSNGVYGLVRHPIYLGWLLLVWPAPVMTGTRLVFAAVSTAYLVAAVPLEERALRRLFGSQYDAYARRVRWKMLPYVY
jgi:protein-S-isoprenylcysteine O-methyltransferase Ste14